MGINPEPLLDALRSDLKEYLPFGPVGLGGIPPDASYKQFVSTYFMANVTKKWLSQTNILADDAALGKFLTSNKKCEDWRIVENTVRDSELIGEFRRELDDFLHPNGLPLLASYSEILDNARPGPGSAIGARGFSYYAKFFASRMTTTSERLYSAYSGYISRFPDLDEAFAKCRSEMGEPLIVKGSRISFAPKTRDISRLICVEPSLNMYFQLGLGTLLEDRLRVRFLLNLKTRPSVNQRLSRIGSIDGSYATIDLSSASDSLSWSLFRAFLPEWFYLLLQDLRSDTSDIRGVDTKLNMISTMGNGFTFPLQTVIFSCLIRAAYRLSNVKIEDRDPNWSCFGDDLIVKRECFYYVCRLLQLIGCDLNSEKTFNEGWFRESCGSDWFHGQPVRPIFLKKLDSLQDIFVAINLLNNWSAYTGIPLPEGVGWLLSQIKDKSSLAFVPFAENNDSGVRVPIDLRPKSYGKDANMSYRYTAYRARPLAIRVLDGKLKIPKGYKQLIFNPLGLEMSFLYGELSDYRLPVRQLVRPRYSRKASISPYWDWYPTLEASRGGTSSWQQWETAVSINLDILRRKADG